MLSVFATGATVLTDDEFLRGVGLVAFGDVVEMPTFGAFQSHVLSWSFFCHV